MATTYEFRHGNTDESKCAWVTVNVDKIINISRSDDNFYLVIWSQGADGKGNENAYTNVPNADQVYADIVALMKQS